MPHRLRNLVRLVVVASRSLMQHKLRSLLTVLGLVFGVASVIVMLAVGEGASNEAQKQIESLGAKNIIVRSLKPVEDSNKSEENEGIPEYGVTYDDLHRISETVPSVIGATPVREFRQEARYLDRSMESRVVGVVPDYLTLNALHVAQGRFVNSVDVEVFNNICVLGSELAETLFPYSSPLGKSVRVGPQHYYKVVGVTDYRAPSGNTGSSLSAQDYNRDVYMPLSTNRVRFGETLAYSNAGSFSWERLELSQITVEIDKTENVKPTATVLEDLLSQFHPRNDFAITVPLELLERAEETKRIFNLVLGSTAAVSLLVGGIGIMNIMLATVTERTREIGIRRALGATRRDIISQFLVETGVLSLTGSLLGVAVGLTAPSLVSWLSGRDTIVTLWSPLLALSVALTTGIVFGVYPAIRAAHLDPIEALRAE